MIRSAITVSRVEQARGGPFVFWDELPVALARAAGFGFDAVELFLPGGDAVGRDVVAGLLEKHALKLAAVGTGAGWVVRKLSLTSPDALVREEARRFIKGVIDLGGPLGAPAIVGSMQGRFGEGVERDTAMNWLRNGLDELGDYAGRYGLPLLYEPLNRYETNLCNTIAQGAEMVEAMRGGNVKLLADLFHMNIEEASIGDALRRGWKRIGHVHLADSNRRAMGLGHTAMGPIAEALDEIGYGGYVSAEVFPLPDEETAAAKTMEAHRKWFGSVKNPV